jgi:hypothetical protein
VSHNLAELLRKFEKFWGHWFLCYEFLFTTARTLCLYVCLLVSSLHTIVPWYTRLPHYLTTNSFIMDRVYPCTLTPAWFSLLLDCPDGQRWICVG